MLDPNIRIKQLWTFWSDWRYATASTEAWKYAGIGDKITDSDLMQSKLDAYLLYSFCTYASVCYWVYFRPK